MDFLFFLHREKNSSWLLFYFYAALIAANQIVQSFQKETSLTIEQSAALSVTIVEPSSYISPRIVLSSNRMEYTFCMQGYCKLLTYAQKSEPHNCPFLPFNPSTGRYSRDHINIYISEHPPPLFGSAAALSSGISSAFTFYQAVLMLHMELQCLLLPPFTFS